MAKEYRKKTRAKPAATSKMFMFVLISFVAGYLTASIFNLASLNTWFKTQVIAQNPQPAAAKRVAQTQIPKPKFEFYTLLSNEHAPVGQKSEPAVPTPDPVTNASNVMSNTAVKTMAAKNPALPPVSAPTATMVASEKVLAASKLTSPTVALKESFLVQVASFNRREDAERIKASLILKGFNVNIATVNQQHVNWYRVILGPFSSRTLAEKAQVEVARSERLRGMIRKMDT